MRSTRPLAVEWFTRWQRALKQWRQQTAAAATVPASLGLLLLLLAFLAALAPLSAWCWLGDVRPNQRPGSASLPIFSFPSTPSLPVLSEFPANGTVPTHLIAACADVSAAALLPAVASWMAVPDLSTATVVDLGGAEPLHRLLRPQLQDAGSRLRVIRISEALPHLRASGLHLALYGLSYAEPSMLLKVDCDAVLDSAFISSHPPSPEHFYSTAKRDAADAPGEDSLPAVLFAPTYAFLAARGYDERMQSASALHEDAHVWLRLHDELLLSARRLDPALIRRAQRVAPATTAWAACGTGAGDAHALCPSWEEALPAPPREFLLRYQEGLVNAAPAWDPSVMGSQFVVLLHNIEDAASVYVADVVRQARPVEASISSAQRIRAVQDAAASGLDELGLSMDALGEEALSRPAFLLRLLSFYGTDGGRGQLVVHVQHGLSNRLRALASALAVATSMDLTLKVIWTADLHCRATFSDLFRLPSADPHFTHPGINPLLIALLHTRPQHLWEDSAELPAVHALSPRHFDVHHYVDEEGRATDISTHILSPGSGRSLYVRSASRLNHTEGLADVELSLALRALVLGREVKAMVDGYHERLPSAALSTRIGLHIRTRSPRSELRGLRADEYTAASWAAISEARALSGVDSFLALIAEQRARTPRSRFYVAADDPSALLRLEAAHGADVIAHFDSGLEADTRGRCSSPDEARSVHCVQSALADMLLLSQTRVIHGSYWSAFSEVAGLWRPTRVVYAKAAAERVRNATQRVQSGEGA